MGAKEPPPSAAVVLVDDGEGRFGPLLDLRPVFGLRTGVFTTGERLARRFGRVVAARVPPALAEVAAESLGLPVNTLPAGDAFLFVNGRVVEVQDLPTPPLDEAFFAADGTVLSANLSRRFAEGFMSSGGLPDRVRASEVAAPRLIRMPWHVLDGLAKGIAADVASIESNLSETGYQGLPEGHPLRMGSYPILVHPTATLAPHVVLDASDGPIVIGEQAMVRPFSVVCGPAAIGPNSIVADRSLIKANTTCGPCCRLGGEIGGTSIIGYSNKTHDGHLGDAVVGEWANFGAGTDNSNLLNTYGEVSARLEPDGPRLRTGRVFFGTVVGDHAKFAIGTRLMTGTVVGTGAMIASSRPPPSTVRRFAWITDEGERQYQLAKFIEVATTVMARRRQVPRPAYLARLATLHAEA